MPKNGRPASTSTSSTGVAISSGRRMTARAIATPQPVAAGAHPRRAGSSSTRRSERGSGTRSRLTRGPSIPSSAGSTVRPKTRVERTVTTPPMPMLRRAGDSNTVRLDRPMATATPLIATALPTVAMVCSTASATDRWRSSSRNRLTVKSE